MVLSASPRQRGATSRRLAAVAVAIVAAAVLPEVLAPSGRAAWDLRTTGRQVVVQGHQAHPGRLPSSFHMTSVEDTAEECRDTGAVSFSSSDLELVSDRDSSCLGSSAGDDAFCAGIGSGFIDQPSVDRPLCEAERQRCVYDPPCMQEIGVRFQKVYVPHGAVITEAFMVFDVDEQPVGGQPATAILNGDLTVTIAAQSADNAEEFLEEQNNIAKRPRTQASVTWAIPAWRAEHTLEGTVDISPVIAEVVGRNGWAAGNSIVIMIRHESGEGVRVAESFRQGTPELKVKWEGEMVLGSSGLDTYVSGQHAVELLHGIPGTAVGNDVDALMGQVTTHKQCECLELPYTSSPFESTSDQVFTGALAAALRSNTYGNYQQTVALRFTGLIIPQGALITSARLLFMTDADDDNVQPVTLRISAALTEHAPTFDCNSAAGIGSRSDGVPCTASSRGWVTARLGDPGVAWDGPGETRPRGRTSAYVEWSPEPWDQPGASKATPNLGLIIQELVNQAAWAPGSSVALVIEPVSGDGKRRAKAGSASGDPPELEIAWSMNTPATRQVLHSGIGKEMACDGDNVRVGALDLEMPINQRWTVSTDCEQVIGLYYENMDIANGAIISGAFLTFDVDESSGTCDARPADAQVECARAASAPVTLRIRAEASDHASPIVEESSNLSLRPKTVAEIMWSPDPWTTASALKRTPDISAILQELVNRPGWREGSSVLLTVEKVYGDGSRIAESQFAATPSLTYTMLGGDRGLPPFELLSNAELAAAQQESADAAAAQTQAAADAAAEEAGLLAQVDISAAQDEKSMYSSIAVL